ncbi:unnamed protein product [Blepharisma stoltei]|uniref:Uncharacterized protein n=1 Tax=Blepharisma stoltei TaxID=1481888 RepID=A0AAU9I8S9_9CILI|nr:unnamed protein product [Blepharisma stoltei]
MSSDDVGVRLSQKLLQGWCMLNKNCEECYTPIMKKDNKEYCCGCQRFLEEEKKSEPTQVIEKPEISHKNDTHNQEDNKTPEITDSTSIYHDFPDIKTVRENIFNKMLELSNHLPRIKDYSEISKLLKMISDCDSLLRQLK